MNPPAFARSRPIAGTRRRRPTIGLTPLIDVVFILLVFFMLATSFVDWRSIALTVPPAGLRESSVLGAILIEVRPDGLRMAGRPIAMSDLEASIRAGVVEKPDQAVLVAPAEGVSLQRAVLLLDRLSAAGATNLSLIRNRPQ